MIRSPVFIAVAMLVFAAGVIVYLAGHENASVAIAAFGALATGVLSLLRESINARKQEEFRGQVTAKQEELQEKVECKAVEVTNKLEQHGQTVEKKVDAVSKKLDVNTEITKAVPQTVSREATKVVAELVRQHDKAESSSDAFNKGVEQGIEVGRLQAQAEIDKLKAEIERLKR